MSGKRQGVFLDKKRVVTGEQGNCREGEIWFVPACVGVALPAPVGTEGNLYLYGFGFRRR